jgi:hypothetical protein
MGVDGWMGGWVDRWELLCSSVTLREGTLRLSPFAFRLSPFAFPLSPFPFRLFTC